MNAEVEHAGVCDGLSFLKIPNGRMFYGYISHRNHQHAYHYVRDLLPKQLNKDTFLLGLDVVHRYVSDFAWLPEKFLPGRGGIIVEAGAYLGHKAIRFVDEVVGTEGKVLAIEMMPDNVRILRKNIIENGLESCIDVLEAGIWKEHSKVKVYGKSRQRNTIIHLEKLDEDTGIVVPTYSLDEILENWGHEPVDLLYVTLNGAEIEALQGLNVKLNSVKIMFIASPYAREGIPNMGVVSDLLNEKGCHILNTRGSSIIAVTPRYRDEFI
jgi:FkbM family methyltransferase